MRNLLFILASVFLFSACESEQKESSSINPINWEKRRATPPEQDSLQKAKTLRNHLLVDLLV